MLYWNKTWQAHLAGWKSAFFIIGLSTNLCVNSLQHFFLKAFEVTKMQNPKLRPLEKEQLEDFLSNLLVVDFNNRNEEFKYK